MNHELKHQEKDTRRYHETKTETETIATKMCNNPSTGSPSDTCDYTVTPRNLLCQQWTIYVYCEQTQKYQNYNPDGLHWKRVGTWMLKAPHSPFLYLYKGVTNNMKQIITQEMCAGENHSMCLLLKLTRLKFKLKIRGRGRFQYNKEYKMYWEQNRTEWFMWDDTFLVCEAISHSFL